MAVTWNPADKDASITLSNGDLTATGSAAAYRMVRGTTAFATGKRHIEYALDASAAWNESGIGLAASSESLTTYVGVAGNKSLAIFTQGPNTQLYFNDVISGLIGPVLTNGMRLALEIDFDAGLIWGALDTNDWNGSATAVPATGAGGYNISSVIASGSLYPAFNAHASGDAVTVKPAAADFTRAISSGFSAWDAPVIFDPKTIDPLSTVPYKRRAAPIANR